MGIFVSFSSQDRDEAERLIQQLGTLEQDVYFEQKSPLGKVWWSQVFDTIKHSDLFVFALTPHTVNSYARIMECSYALALHKRILWVMIKNIVRLPPELSATQIVDYREDSDAAAQAFAEALTQLPPPEPLPVPLPLPPNWLAPLNELRQRLETPDLTYREQRWITNNLQDFLERRETFDTAVSMLKLQLEQPITDPRIRQDIIGILSNVDPQFLSHRRRTVTAKGVAIALGSTALLAALLTNVLPLNIPGLNAAPTSVANLATSVGSTLPPAQQTLSAQVGGISGSMVTQVALVSTIPPTNRPPAGRSPQLATATPSEAAVVYTGIKVDDASDGSGVRVVEVGPAARQAGVHVGDYVLSVDAQPIASRAEFLAAMAGRRPVSVVVLRLQRAGDVILARLTTSVTDYIVEPATPPAR